MSTLKSIHEIVRCAEEEYTNGTATISDHVEFSMHETIEKTDAYLNSKHTSGETDSMGREKPFFNIVLATRNIWYRSTDIDRKNIRFIPTTLSSVVLAFVANMILQRWMDKNRFGHFLNRWGKSLASYGSSVAKFTERGDELIATVIPWNRFIPDQIDFDAIPRIEKFYMTPEQLRQEKLYDQDMVDGLIDSITTRKKLDGTAKDSESQFIEIYEVHGNLDSRLLQDDPDLGLQDKDIKYRQQMHVVSFVRSDNDSFDDYTLYKGKEAFDPYIKSDLMEEDGRTLGMGAVEYLFDAQWMANHTVKNMKDTLDITSKLIFQTSDDRYANRNVLSAIQTGDIFHHAVNQPLTQVNTGKSDIASLQNFSVMWQNLAQEISSTPDALRGTTMPSGTPYSLGSFLGAQAGSLFEIMTENKGLAIEDMMRLFIIPHIKKQLKNKDEVVGFLEDSGIQEIDAMYVPNEAVKRYNERTTEQVLAGGDAEEFNPEQEQAELQTELSQLGNLRSLVPDKIGKKTWADIFSDFQWDSIKVEVTNENVDKSAVLQTLSTVLQSISSNPQILQDPNAKMVFSAILSETGRISPMQLTTASAQAKPANVDLEGLEGEEPAPQGQ